MTDDLGAVTVVVAAQPGRTAAEIRDALRTAGRVSITAGDVASVLRRNPHRFAADGAEPARWWPAGQQPARAVSADGAATFEPYRWQVDALAAWRRNGERGVVEAVTGTGKTILGVVAIVAELARGGQALVLVPTRELADQWCTVLARHGPGTASVGRLGGGQRADLGRHDIVVSVVNSARDADLRPRRPGGLLVADECHRYGSDGNRVALHADFPCRLGLSATYARSDDGHLTWLDPYFGGTCYRIGYERAIGDGIIAPFTVTLLGVDMASGERAEYDILTLDMAAARAQLVAAGHAPAEPIGAFFAAASLLARSGDGAAAAAARRYLGAQQARRRLLADMPARRIALDGLAPCVATAGRTIVFTHDIATAHRAVAQLGRRGIAAAAIHSQLALPVRRDVLVRFGSGALRAVAAPQVLDEGVDVPDADMAIVLAASRSRRQMIQRMGRVLRRKDDGRAAHLVIVYAIGTVEDPASGAHDGFLDEVLPVADAVEHRRAS